MVTQKIRPMPEQDAWVYEYKGGKTLLDLNDDVMFEILAHIDNIREVLRLKQVCRKFEAFVIKYLNFCPTKINQISHIFYQSEFGKNGLDPRLKRLEINLSYLLSNCKRLSQLNTLFFTDFVWWDLSSDDSASSLISLEMRISHPTLSGAALTCFFSKCVNLEKLILWNFCRLKMDLNCLSSSITSLELKDHGSDAAILKLLCAKGYQLKCLKLGNHRFSSSHQARVDKITESNLVKIIEYCPNLESLSLINYIMLGDYVGCCLRLKNFKQIIIDSPRVEYRFDRHQYTQLLTNNPNLTHLTIPVHSTDFMEFFKSCQIHCPRLQYLDSLTSQLYDDITRDAIMKIWSKFLNLEELNKFTKSKFTNHRKQLHPVIVRL